MVRDSSRFWRVQFHSDDPAAPDFVDRLDNEGIAISVFESEADDKQVTIAWRVEILFDEEPNLELLSRSVAAALGRKVDLQVFSLTEEDWIGALERSREPLRIGRFLLHAGGLPADIGHHTLAIELEAGLAFGTGEHPTTGGCLRVFDGLLRRRRFRAVLDMGCGTAVLAMAAAKAGSRHVLAVDIDPAAVGVALDNVRLNRLSRAVSVIQGDGFADPRVHRLAPYNLIFANILAGPLIDMAPGLRRCLAPGGVAILAGLLDDHAESVIEAYRRCGMRLLGQENMDSWAILAMRRPGLLGF